VIVACCPWCGAEFGAADTRCWDCKLGLTDLPEPTLPEGGDEADEVGFELEEWSAGERGRLSAGLRERGIAFRWEPGLTLVVGTPDEELVDALLDDMESEDLSPGGGNLAGGTGGTGGTVAADDDDDAADDDDDDEDEDDEEDEDGGERAQAAMGDLFVAADRLIQRPDDGRVAEALLAATAIVAESRPPYGFEALAWLQIRELASATVEAIESEADDVAVAREARTLRDALRPYI